MSARKFDVTLPEDVIDAIENRVEAGRYGSIDEVMEAAVEALFREENAANERLAGIRHDIRQSINDPALSLSSGDMRAHVERLYAKHRG